MDLIRRIKARIDSMISRAVINRVNEALAVQRLQVTVLADEVVDDVDHVQAYGMSFNPPEGSEAIVLNVNGSSAHPLAILAHAPGERPTDADPGCGGLYTAGEWRLYVSDDGKVHLGAAGKAGAAAVARADKVDAEIAALRADIQAVSNACGLINATGSVTFTPYVPPSLSSGESTASDTVTCDPPPSP